MGWQDKLWKTKTNTNPKVKRIGMYLITYNGYVRQARRCKKSNDNSFYWSLFPENKIAYEDEVTAWMPQIKPYLGKEGS